MNAVYITPAQARYIRILANGLDLGTLDERAVAVIRVAQAPGVETAPVARSLAGRTIDYLLKVREHRGLTEATGTTENQVDYLLALAVRKGVRDQITQEHLDRLTFAGASKLIDALKEMPDAETENLRPTERKSSHNPNGVGDGLYQTPDGEIYKVQVAVHGSGKLYAKRLVELEVPRQLKTGVRTHEFVREPGALAKLTPEMAMTEEQARAFGKLYGTCCNCGLTLTNEDSIEWGIGPKCRAKRGWV